MKHLFYLGMMLLLGFSACKKENQSEKVNDETFVLDGQTYSVSETREKLAKLTGVDKDELVFFRDSLAFTQEGTTSFLKIEMFIGELNKMKL
ncbi:hypothetical protein [Parapedobacter tibetensis]|uniref:hypothetical protein n=1 Tax=Parapedobacter tibetensis TaxID=2972951 RepID=UPI00214D6F43|nr:hypothetical protein [Parapedobacter tibetensis]